MPVLYAFEQGLKMPFIGILFFYPLVPVISIALDQILFCPYPSHDNRSNILLKAFPVPFLPID